MAPEQAKHKGKERVAAAELGKRARISDAEPRPHAEPFLRADQSMLGQLQMNIKSSYEIIVGALERLPMQIARAMPAAVKEAPSATLISKVASDNASRRRQKHCDMSFVMQLDMKV